MAIASRQLGSDHNCRSRYPCSTMGTSTSKPVAEVWPPSNLSSRPTGERITIAPQDPRTIFLRRMKSRVPREARRLVFSRHELLPLRFAKEPETRVRSEHGSAAACSCRERSAIGKRIRVAAPLVDAATGYHLWSGLRRDLGDPFVIQDELSSAIGEAVRWHVS